MNGSAIGAADASGVAGTKMGSVTGSGEALTTGAMRTAETMVHTSRKQRIRNLERTIDMVNACLPAPGTAHRDVGACIKGGCGGRGFDEIYMSGLSDFFIGGFWLPARAPSVTFVCVTHGAFFRSRDSI